MGEGGGGGGGGRREREQSKNQPKISFHSPPLGVGIIRVVDVIVFLIVGEVVEDLSLLLALLGRGHLSRVLLAPLGPPILKPHL